MRDIDNAINQTKNNRSFNQIYTYKFSKIAGQIINNKQGGSFIYFINLYAIKFISKSKYYDRFKIIKIYKWKWSYNLSSWQGKEVNTDKYSKLISFLLNLIKYVIFLF